jgi:hypothetical protein
MEFKKVTKEEFYFYLQNLDAIHTVDDSKGFPYGGFYTLRGSREIIAKKVPADKNGFNYYYYIKQNK